MYKNIGKWTITIISVISAIVTILSAIYAHLQVNMIHDQRSSEEVGQIFEMIKYSVEKTSQIYDSIDVFGIMEKGAVSKKDKNALEEMGQIYCDGLLLSKHVKLNFGDVLKSACQKIDVKDARNGIKILCYEFGNQNMNADMKNCYTLNRHLDSKAEIFDKYGIPRDLYK